MNTIPLAQIGTIGGYQDKPYIAPPSILLTRGLDPFRTPGVLESAYLEQDFGTNSIDPISTNVIAVIYKDAVDAYIITVNKIYTLNMSTGAYTTIHNVSNCRNAVLFNGYIYIALTTRYVMRLNVADNTLNTTWGDFLTSASLRPMVISDGVLYIGNNQYVSLVDETATFVYNALDIPTAFNISALYGYGNELYIGAENETEKSEVKTYRWNTWSESFSMEGTLNEDYLYGFFVVDGRMYLCTGSEESAKIFAYGEPTPSLYTTIPLRDSLIRYGPDIFVEFNGRVYIGTTFQTTDGNSDGGVWVFGSVTPGANPVLVQMFSAPSEDISGTDIIVTCICPSKDRFIYGYKNGSTYGLARVSTTSKRTDFILTSSYLDLTRGDSTLPNLRVHCTNLGDASSATARAYTNGSSTYAEHILSKDIVMSMLYSEGYFAESAFHKIEVRGILQDTAIRGLDFSFN